MAPSTGTYDISSLKAARFQSAAEFGLDTIQAVLEADIEAHNAIVNSMVAEMCEVTTDRQRIYGTSADGEMVEVDEYGRAATQRPLTGSDVGFPLKLFQFNLGWTDKWLETHTPADMAMAVEGAEKAHLKKIQSEIKKAIFLSANYTHRDHLVDNVNLSAKRFVNADGASIPDGPNGETFDGSTHTHYDANATLTATVLKNNVNDVIEHGHGSDVRLAIAKADETAVRALSGFNAYVDPRLAFSTIATTGGVPAKTLDISRLDNRAIGTFEGSEVWVKPWAIANYSFAWDAGTPNKPLVFRQREQERLQGLRIAAENKSFPLIAKFMEAEYGIAVWTRTNGAVLYFAGGSYTDPSI